MFPSLPFSRRRAAPETGVADCEALLADLSRPRHGVPYTDADRRRDFRNVFLSTPAGKRVLYEILTWSRLFASTFVPGDAYATHWREGGRDVGLRLLTVLNMRHGDTVAGRAPDNDSEKEA